MKVMLISVVNQGAVSALDAKLAVAACNKQLMTDFARYWDTKSTVKLAASGADAIIYLSRDTDIEGVLGYHDITNAGKPYGVILTEISRLLGEPWSATLSHEVLELVADPEVNRYVLGQHPTENRPVFYWYESCDAVQNETYTIDGVRVSNFVLPLYFTGRDEAGSKNDFMKASGRTSRTLRSLGLAPGGYAGYFDPETGYDEYVFADRRAQERFEIKKGRGSAGRGARYKNHHSPV